MALQTKITPDVLSMFYKDRKYARARITRIHNLRIESLSEEKRAEYYDTMLELKSEITEINRQIHQNLPEDANLESILGEEDIYSGKISEVLRKLKPIPVAIPVRSDNSIINESNKLKLPTISLPEFSNDKKESLERFIYAFESIVNKHNLSEYEKFIYLKGQLRKGPLTLTNSLDSRHQTYQNAKELLFEAFGSALTQKYEVIKKLSELKLQIDGDIYNFISEMRSITCTFKELDINIETVIQFFVWQGMNDRLQSQLIQITNNSKPTLDEINENIFAATERYLRITEQISERKNRQQKFQNYNKPNYSKVNDNSIKTNNFAIKINNKPFIKCNLCIADNRTNISHILKDCDVYQEASDKVGKLSSLNFCTKCSFANHSTSQCKFKFSSTCRLCGGFHYTHLCTNPCTSNNENRRGVISNMSCVHFNSTILNDNVLLPSFTAQIDSGGLSESCRILNDTGSQRNFILQSLVKKLKLSVVKRDVNMTIHGFNSEKNILTNIVSVPLKINGISYDINAIAVPAIDINVRISNLSSIVNNFTAKGYLLADEQLGHSGSGLSAFDMVMGPDATRLLRPNTFVLGPGPDHSVFLRSELGVLLLGETSSLLRNLKYLKCINNNKMTENRYMIKLPDESLESDSMNNFHEMSVNFSSVEEVLNDKGDLIQSKLERATGEALEQYSNAFLSYDMSNDSSCSEVNNKIIDYVLDNTDRTPDGRLIMPLPWNPECKNLLGCNYNLSKKILYSNLNKLKKDDKISLYNEVFLEQERLGIVERIENVDRYMKDHPDCSFLPHMGVFKMKRETTKVRVVYLSNLCEKNKRQPNAVSHNNALLAGPCLNSKLSTSLLLSRFDKYILIFDITKAFLGIQLNENDQNKLLCLWFKSIKDNDYSLIAYKNLRLSFGLRPSPTILMLGLYKLLILDIENDDKDTILLKQLVYNNIFMDNGLVSSDNKTDLNNYYQKLPGIFSAYQFSLQQYASNDLDLQNKIDDTNNSTTDKIVKFFGLQWNRCNDTFSPFPINLDSNANSKRKILSSLNSIYDIYNLYGPIVNRAKIFFQGIQHNQSYDWDTNLPPDVMAEWRKICKQINATPTIELERFVGSRKDSFSLIAFSDSSAAIYGVVVYLRDNITNKISFLMAKSRVISTKSSKKTIPSLECMGVTFAAEILIDLYHELGKDKNINPITIDKMYIYTDSMVTLSWIRGYFINHEKMQKRSTYVLNRLKQISDLTEIFPITFRYIEGRYNPADCISRCISYNKLMKTCYFTGPSFLTNPQGQEDIEITIPSDMPGKGELTSQVMVSQVKEGDNDDQSTPMPQPLLTHHLLNIEEHSSFQKLIGIYANVLKFVYKLKGRIQFKKSREKKYVPKIKNFYSLAFNVLINTEQNIYFADAIDYLKTRKIKNINAPNLILQMNLYLDENSLLRVKSKFNDLTMHPILLSKDSYLTRLIVVGIHEKFSHVGLYSTLRELRKRFWVTKGFSVVRRILKKCVVCHKVNARPIKLNQSNYRDFRYSPSKVPFAYIFLDYIGPINVKFDGINKKVWILIITCLYTRAISLKICFNADTNEFLRNLQLHVYEHGLFQLCLSDLGSQITSGSRLVRNLLDDIHCHEFFQANGIKTPSFEQYAKGNSSLGSLIEILVKQTKLLITKSIGKNILSFPDFQTLIYRTVHIVNRRPVAFKETLRDFVDADLPTPITPEMLLYGRELVSLNIIPQPQFDDFHYEENPNFMRQSLEKISRVHKKLFEIYNCEFLTTLISQAVDKRDRYKPVKNCRLSVGDIVLLIEPHTKQNNYPLGIIRSITKNTLGEVTNATVFKGKTRESVFRHASSLIKILEHDEDTETESQHDEVLEVDSPNLNRKRRVAAVKAEQEIARQILSGSI